jgi:hypothetical protein
MAAVPRSNSASSNDMDLLAQRQGHDVIAHGDCWLGIEILFL